MSVWRWPFFSAAALLDAIVLLAVIVFALARRRRARTDVVRGLWSAAAAVAVILSPLLFLALIEPELRSYQQHGTYIHPPLWLGWAPATFDVIVLGAAAMLFPRTKWRVAFVAIALLFAALNLANWCQPGWCGRYGFPFAYSWWSDAFVIVNGQNLSAGESSSALAANALVFAGVAAAMAVLFRLVNRRHAPIFSPETPRQRAVLAIASATLCAIFLYFQATNGAALMAAALLGCLLREIRYRRRRADASLLRP